MAWHLPWKKKPKKPEPGKHIPVQGQVQPARQKREPQRQPQTMPQLGMEPAAGSPHKAKKPGHELPLRQEENLWLRLVDRNSGESSKVLLHVHLAQMCRTDRIISFDSGNNAGIIFFIPAGQARLEKSGLRGLHESYSELCRRYAEESPRNKPIIEKFISAYSSFWQAASRNPSSPDYRELHEATRNLLKSTIAITSEDRGGPPIIPLNRINSSLNLLGKIQQEHEKQLKKT